MLKISRVITSELTSPELFATNIDQSMGQKLYLPSLLSFMDSPFNRSTSMVDSGSDINIMQLSYFLKLFPHLDKAHLLKGLEESTFTLTSYTNHKIAICGKATMKVKFHKEEQPNQIDIYIVDSERSDTKTPVIFSLNALFNLGISIQHMVVDNKHQPYLTRSESANNKNLPVYYGGDTELLMVHGFVDRLGPGELKNVEFILSPTSPFLPGNEVMVSQDLVPYKDQNDIKIFASVSTIMNEAGEYYAMGAVRNIGQNVFKGVIRGSIESVKEGQQIRTVTAKNVKRIRKEIGYLVTECRPVKSQLENIKTINLLKTIDIDGTLNKDIYKLDAVFPEFSPNQANSKSQNNDVKNLDTALSEENFNLKEDNVILTEEEIEKFHDKSHSVQLGYQGNLPNLTETDLLPDGYSVPSSVMEQPEDIVLEKDYPAHIWPHVKKIFLDKYPQVVSRHSLDRGYISDTLGYYNIALKPNVSLPRHKKLYYLDPGGSSMMRDILEFLVKVNVISKSKTSGSEISQFASPCFLVQRAGNDQSDKARGKAARLVVNYKLLNQAIKIEPITLSNFELILGQVRGAALFSSIDLKSAFQSIEISPKSRKLTTFATQFGSYEMNTLCTGLASSPNALARFCDVMLNYIPTRDEKGDIKLDKGGYPIMTPDYLNGMAIYYDDVLIYSKAKATYKETVEHHFALIDKIIGRLAFHRTKLDMSKANLAKSRINFLGWFLTNDYLIADPKRIEKIKNSEFPTSVKQMRSWLGMLNTLRLTLNFSILDETSCLTPLTSSLLKKWDPSQEQREAFKRANGLLTRAPLYSKVVMAGAPKILMTDASSASNSHYSCVLAQIVPSKNPEITVPYYLNLDDKCHQIIFDNNLPSRPVPLQAEGVTDKDYLYELKLKHPPEHLYLEDPNMGYGDNVTNSLGISIQLILKLHKCSQNYTDLCKKIHDKLRDHIGFYRILQDDFYGDHDKMKQYMRDIKEGKLIIDKNLQIIEVMAIALYRTIVVVNSTEAVDGLPIIYLNPSTEKPHFYMLLYKRGDLFVIRPTLLDCKPEYSLSKHAGSFEIILYHSKVVPDMAKSNPIYQLELFALLGSLEVTEKLRGNDETLALVDNKVVYFLYHNLVIKSSTKLTNWGHKLHQYKFLKLAFISSQKNPSDWLSRQFQVSVPEIKRIDLPSYVSTELDENMPDETMSSLDWSEWVKSHPEYLVTINDTGTKKVNQIKMDITIGDNKARESQWIKDGSRDNKFPDLKDVNNRTYAEFEAVYKSRKRDNIRSSFNERREEVISPDNYATLCQIKADIIRSKHIRATRLHKKTRGSGLSPHYIKRNVGAIFDPIRSLEEDITPETIAEYQQEEFPEEWAKATLGGNHDETHKPRPPYEIHFGLLLMHRGSSDNKLRFPSKPKIMLPTKLLSRFVAMAHLASNHSGARRMQLMLSRYYHPKLLKMTVKYSTSCLACLLVNGHHRMEKLGLFPLDNDPGEVLHMDLIESLGTASGFNHILCVKEPISNFIQLIPMVGKTTAEFLHIFATIIFPLWHPRALFCDNASFFVSKETIRTLHSMGTRMLHSTAYSGMSHGGVERYVGLTKVAFKKVLAAEPNYNWSFLSSTVSHLHNTSKLPKSGYSPYEILFGCRTHMSRSFLDLEITPKVHPALKNEKVGLEVKFKEIQEILKTAREAITKDRDDRTERVNKNRVVRDINVGDIVFVRDRTKTLGSTKPLATTFHLDPFIVIQVPAKAVLARRISDSFVVRRNRNEIKLYKSMDPDFNDLPEIVKKICTSDYHNISPQDLKELLNTDDLDFEKFSKEEDEVLEEVIATKEEMSETPVAEVTSREEIEEKILEEDNPEIKEDGPQTRSKTAQQLEKAATEDNIEKEVHFDATAEKPQVKFF